MSSCATSGAILSWKYPPAPRLPKFCLFFVKLRQAEHQMQRIDQRNDDERKGFAKLQACIGIQ